MKVVAMNRKPNLELIATLVVLLEKAQAGEIQAMAVAVQVSATDADSVYVGSMDPNMDERVLLGELHILVTDTALSLATSDPQTFASRLMVESDE